MTKITTDEAIAQIRMARECIENCAHSMVQYRATIKAQAARIRDLESKLSYTVKALDAADKQMAEQQTAALSVDAVAGRMHPRFKARWHRIAVGALNRIRDGHPILAEQLLITLVKETRDDRDDRVATDSREARPHDHTQTCRSVGIPYIGE